MTESDDFLSAPGIDAPKAKPAQTATRTASALPQTSEAAKKNRRLQASLLTREFAPPKLGIPGLDAINKSSVLG
jgi:hypothetical protein